jgi:hypothetical protein
MATCEVCGNEYDKTFELIQQGRRHVFDSDRRGRAPVRALPVHDHRTRGRSRRAHVLLRQLRRPCR